MKKRRMLALLLTLVMTLSLAACGAQETPSAQEQPDAAESSEAAGTGETPTVSGWAWSALTLPTTGRRTPRASIMYPSRTCQASTPTATMYRSPCHIADELGAELVIVKLAWSGLIEALNAGQIDMIIAGMADTAERRESINFSDPYKLTEYGLMVNGDSPYADATSIQDFSGASVLGQKDTMLDTVIDQIEGVNHLPAVDSVPNQISRLAQGTCDAIVVNMENTPGYLAANPTFKVIEFADGQGFDLGFNGCLCGPAEG